MSRWRDALKALQSADDVIEEKKRAALGYGIDRLQDAGGLALSGAGEIWNLMTDSPYQKEWIGDANRLAARVAPGHGDFVDSLSAGLTGPLGIVSDRLIQTKEKDRERIREIDKAGGSGRDVWESNQDQLTRVERAINDLAIDPTTYLGFGSSSVGKNLITKGDEIAQSTKFMTRWGGDIVRRTGKAVDLYTLPDRFADRKGAELVSALSRTRPGRWLTQPSERTVLRREMDHGYSILKRVLDRDLIREQEKGMAAVSGAVPAIGPADPSQNYRGALRPFTSIAPTNFEDAVVSRVGKFIAGTNARKLMARDVDDAFDVQIMRGPYKGETMSRPIFDGLGEAERDFRELESLFDSKNGVISVRKAKGNVARVKELQAKYNQVPLANARGGYDPGYPGTLPLMREEMVRQKLRLDPTIPSLSEEENAWLLDEGLRMYNPRTKKYEDMSHLDATKTLMQQFVDDSNTIRADLKPGTEWQKGERDWDLQRHKLTDTKALRAFDRWTSMGVDPIHETQINAAIVGLEREMYRDRGLESKYRIKQDNIWGKFRVLYGEAMGTWKSVALLSPRYHTSSVAGTYINTFVKHGPKAFEMVGGPRNIIDEFKNVRGDASTIHDIASDEIMRVAEEFGNASKVTFKNAQGVDETKYYGSAINRNITSMGSAAMIGGDLDDVERLFGRLHMKSFGKIVNKPVRLNRQISLAVDSNYRTAVWKTGMLSKFEELQPALEREILDYAQKSKVDMGNAVALPFKDPAKALGYYKALGFTEGQARHLSRLVAQARNKAEDHGVKLVHDSLFSYYKTNADEFFEKFIPFHYYASRATVMYAEQAMRNPVLMVNLARMMEELGDTENSGLTARQKGWVQLLSGPAGYSLLLNPDALLGVTKGLGMMEKGDFSPDGQTELGSALQWMKGAGIGLYPWIDGMFNMMGAYGDTFEPDMLGIRHRALVGSIVNYAAAELGADGMSSAFYAEANARSRERISSTLSKFLPGWMSAPVAAKANDTGTIAEATMERAIENRVITNNPGLTYEQLFEIMNDPDSDEFQKAFIEVSRTGFISQLLSFTMPTGMKLRDNASDVRSAMVSSIYKYESEHPGDYDPTGDAEFAAYYKRLTGKEFKIAEVRDAQLKNDLASATFEARPFVLAEHLYSQIGSPKAKEMRNTYNSIKYDGFVPKGYSAPPEGKEEQLADLWLMSQPDGIRREYKEMLDLQRVFRENHPRYSQYLDWRGQLSYLVALVGENGYALYREQVSSGNPNAARYFRAQTLEARKRYGNDATKVTEYLNKRTTTPDAWMAVVGMARHAREQAPIATASPTSIPYDPAQGLIEQATPWNESAGSSGGSSNTQTEFGAFLQGLT